MRYWKPTSSGSAVAKITILRRWVTKSNYSGRSALSKKITALKTSTKIANFTPVKMGQSRINFS